MDFQSPGPSSPRIFLQTQRRTGRILAMRSAICSLALSTLVAHSAPDLSHRMATLRVKSKPGTTVRVEQQSHHFRFGTAIGRNAFSKQWKASDRETYLATLKANFNSVVPENAMKWYATEGEQGDLTYAPCDLMLDWATENGIPMRGHCVYWAVDQFIQPWIKQLDDKALRAALESRAQSLLGRYRGRISEYDLNNEMIHGEYYAKRLGDPIRKQMFEWAEAADPDAVLYLNDYSILNGGDLPKYEKQIESLIAAGAPVGGIGLQGHFGKSGVDTAKVKHVLDSLSRFHLPIKITEFDIDSLDEQVKADGLETLYRTAFAHRSVNGILMWGFWAGNHWRATKKFGDENYTALWDKDWKPTPSAAIYRKLVFDEWWTRAEVVAGADGLCEIPVFLGKHRITSGGLTRDIEITKAGTTLDTHLAPPTDAKP